MAIDREKPAQEIIDTARAMARSGLTVGTAGNVSARYGNGFLITPSAKPYDSLTPEDIVWLDRSGRCLEPHKKPSSEWRFHRDIFQVRPDISAIIHAHPHFATTLACFGLDIPPVHYMIAMAGGATIRCAPYALFGSQQLSDAVVAALVDRKACLMANHGVIACGGDLHRALELALEIEQLCRLYYQALAIGQPRLLSEAEMTEVLAKFADYRP